LIFYSSQGEGEIIYKRGFAPLRHLVKLTPIKGEKEMWVRKGILTPQKQCFCGKPRIIRFSIFLDE
jgi:hypothetical protein